MRPISSFAVVTSLAVLVLAPFGCTESTDGTPTAPDSEQGAADGSVAHDGSTSMSPSMTGTGTGTGTGNDGGTATGSDSSTAAPGMVVINEVSGKGKEWVELYNAGATTVDLSSYTISDGEKDGGAPKPADGAKLPAGTILAPNAYLLAAAFDKDAGTLTCPGGGSCVGFHFGVSNKDGDVVYLLSPADAPVATVQYPANTVASGQTWGRSPNGTGTFGTTLATPGAANQTP